MPTKSERTALVFLSAVVLAGALVRVVRSARAGFAPQDAARSALAAQRSAVDSARRAARAPKPPGSDKPDRPAGRRGRSPRSETPAPRAAPPEPVFPIDINRATAKELEALPRVGPGLAARIVVERTVNGPFADVAALDKRVKGIGPALVKAIENLVTFGNQ